MLPVVVAAAPVAVKPVAGVAEAIGGFVGDLIGGGNPWDKSKDRAQDAGHAASKGDVASVTYLGQIVGPGGTQYSQTRAVALNYLQLLASGRGYDGSKAVTPPQAVIIAAQQTLASLGYGNATGTSSHAPTGDTITTGNWDTMGGNLIPPGLANITRSVPSILIYAAIGVGLFYVSKRLKLIR